MVSRYIQPVPTQAELQAELVAFLRSLIPTWTPDITDPGVYWADYTSGKLLQQIVDFNASADANDVLRAVGAPLDELLMQFGIVGPRIPGQTNEQRRLQFQEQWQSITPGTEANDIIRARKAAPRAGSISRTPIDWALNSVGVYVIDPLGQNLTGEELDAVRNALNNPARDTFWLDYTVAPATIEHYLVSGYIVYDPRESDPLDRVNAGLETVMFALRLLDTGIDDSTLVLMLGRLGASPSHNVERAELSLNLTTASMDDDGTLIIGTPVTELLPVVNTVRWGHIQARVNTPDTTPVRTVWSNQNANAPVFSDPTVRGSVMSALIGMSGPVNRYLWFRIDETGVFSQLNLELTDGTGIPMNQVEDNVWVSNDSGAVLDTLRAGGATIRVASVTRMWPGIESRMKW